MRRVLLLLDLSTALLLACAPPAQRTYIAPSYDTIISTTEEHQADPPLHLVYVENHSTVPVIVFSVRLTNCENINVQCGVHPANVKLDAGQREIVQRIGPKVPTQRWNYSFGFSWRADTSYGTKLLSALAGAGDTSAAVRLAAQQHADSLRRAETGAHYNDLSQSDFTVLAPRIASMRAYPESLVIAPGERVGIEQIRMLLLDNQGAVLGQTRWVRWQLINGAVQFVPPRDFIARRPGRSIIRFSLAEDAQKLIPNPINKVEYPVLAAYAPDVHAPVFEGRVRDADTKGPLACVQVALEDSAQNVIAREHASKDGTFVLSAPRPGTYRVRIETQGWAPVYGPNEVAKPDDDKQNEYLVKFTEQAPRYSVFVRNGDDIEHARPTAVATGPVEPAPKSNARKKAALAEIPFTSMTLGGSEVMPILSIVGKAPAGTTWAQFVVDSTGKVDPASIALPGDTISRRLTSVTAALPRVRFEPARDGDRTVCELLRMQVNFSGR